MILTLLKKNKFGLQVLAAVALLLISATWVYAQSPSQGLSLSVTPTLFEMAAAPTQIWDSSIKVINNNPHELTVYASVVNFAPQGEAGAGKFLPVFEHVTDGSTLAEWITVSPESIVIPAEQSMTIPISVQVPEDATPGGHFAAILVGTRPLDTGESFQVRTSQLVSSLFFVRIAGDVEENGSIREFRTTKKFIDAPEVQFEVRFENKGNVHLQPQGEIVITNMWGKERGIIPINHKTHFGNVLPQSIRKFEFTWKGESSFSDIGRYKAALTLAYGEESRKFVTHDTYFYVIPIKALAIVLGSLIAMILLIGFIIKAYVRRMLALAGVEPSAHAYDQRSSFVREGDVRIIKNVSIKAPMQSGVLDLKARLQNSNKFKEKISAFLGFIVSYKIFFISLILLFISAYAAWVFFTDVTTEQRDYNVVIDNPDANIELSSEDIMYERGSQEAQENIPPADLEQTAQDFELVLVNSSDTPGLAASLQQTLESLGYIVDDLQSDFSESKDRTVIIYHSALQEEALALSRILDHAPISAQTIETGEEPEITVFIGNDRAE